MSHTFHLKLDITLQAELAALSQQYGFRSFSLFLGDILGQVYQVLEERHFFGQSRGSRYELIHSDPELARVSVYADLPEWLYRRLKLVHQDLNLFSIAQMVREMFEFYLALMKEYGQDFEQQLKKLCAEAKQHCKKIPRKFKITKQLLEKRLLKCFEPQFFTFYDSGFEPIRRFRC